MSERPPQEDVEISLGFTQNVESDAYNGVRLEILGADRKVIGHLFLSRTVLGDLLAGRACRPARWRQWRPTEGGDQSGA